MKSRNLRYFAVLAAFALLSLSGCSGGGGGVTLGEKGTSLTVSGQVMDEEKSLTKSLLAVTASDIGTLYVLNAQTGTPVLNLAGNPATTGIQADGSFTDLSFVLPATKSTLVFKAVTNKSVTPFYAIVPIDLSSPPPAGISASNAISILINQTSTNIAQTVSSALGLSGILPNPTASPAVASGMLGDTGNGFPTGQDYTSVAKLVTQFGGQVLAYNTSGLALTGSLKETLLPAQDANALTGDELNSIVLDGAVTGVAIPGNNPIISFQVINKASGKGIRGLKAFAFAVIQLNPGVSSGPDEWLSYMVTSTTSRPSTESVSNTSTPVGAALIDNGDGSYVYKMAKDVKTATAHPGVTYNANLTHRVAIQVRTAPVAGTTSKGAAISNFTNAANLAYDFVPASGAPVTGMLQREIVTTAACNECHTKIGTTTPHGGRVDTRYCVVCHTKQRANGQTAVVSTSGAFPALTKTVNANTGSASYTPTTYVADGEVIGNFVTMVHKIHMGNKLTKANYNYANVVFNPIVYPQDVSNCRKCHKAGAGAQGNNWQTRPSRMACGACHDNINFATGVNLKTGVVTGAVDHIAQADDANCATCHATTSTVLSPDVAHRTLNATPNNPNVAAGLTNFTYDIVSATVDGTNQTVIKFRIMASTDGSTPAAVTFNGTGSNPLSGFTGGPSFLLAYNLSATNQPFTASPDYNNAGLKAAQPLSVSIANLLDGTKGTLVAGTGADAGYYIATIKGDKAPPTSGAYSFPVGAKMRAVALQGYFTQVTPAAARHAVAVQKAVTGDAVRRKVIDSEKCGNCHEWFEGHGGNRVKEIQVCVMCHVPNLSSSGKGTLLTNITKTPSAMSAAEQALLTADGFTLLDPTTYPEETNNLKDMIHGIHAGSSRTNPLKFVRDRTSVVMYFTAAEFVFPGILKDCTMCHTAPTNASSSAPANLSYTGIPAGAQVTTDLTSDGTVLDLTNNVSAVSAARTSLPNAVDLVTTPFTASCVSCHDSVATKAHMKLNGGQIRVLRSAADPAAETCVVCHGPTGTASIGNAHTN